MRYNEIAAVSEALERFRALKSVKRIGEKLIALIHENGEWVVELSADPLIAPAKTPLFPKDFLSPFDRALADRFNGAVLTTVSVAKNDKILTLWFEQSGAYKRRKSALVLELIARRANALIVDENGAILHSLGRNVALGIPYEPPAPPPYTPIAERVANIETILADRFASRQNELLAREKLLHTKAANGKIAKLRSALNALEKPSSLASAAQKARLEGEILLANMKQIAPYSSEITLADFEGAARTIALTRLPNGAKEADKKFAIAKKLKAKAIGIAQEEQNLNDRITFYERLIAAIGAAESMEALGFTLPQKIAQEPKLRTEPVERFVIGSFTAHLGRNERGNELLLCRAKASDLWFHLKGRPSAHLIVSTAKERLPEAVIAECAAICARFSVSGAGRYEVDYTQRRNIKIQCGAQVTYTNYKTTSVKV
ncbi:hypothetical protein AGMMS50229_12910 [Campylobacterota bacterium]|nr:hypothetical protein AGMMS50229_12910 [Campylobacterota bacterium]